MDRIFKTRLWITATFAALFVGLSYELKSLVPILSPIPSILLAIIAFLLGSGLAIFLSTLLINNKNIRKLLLGSSWVEGHWFIETKNANSKDNPLGNPGVLFLDYKVSKNVLKAVTTRIDSNSNEYTVVSQVAYLRTDDDFVQYLNYFKLTSDGKGERYGLAYGEFVTNSDFNSIPSKMLGKISLEGEGEIKEQIARRIPDFKAKELYEIYGDNWIIEVLKSNGELLFS